MTGCEDEQTHDDLESDMTEQWSTAPTMVAATFSRYRFFLVYLA